MITSAEILYLNPRAIEPNRHNVRRDNGDLIGLAESIREHGILQPIGVVREAGGHRVVYGDRRREAAILIGLDRLPCILLENLDQRERLMRNILENLQRLDLNDLEKAQGFEAILEALHEAGLERSEALERMARRLGLSASQIKRYMGLLELAPEVQELIRLGDLGVTHAQHLRQLSPALRQETAARLAVDEHLSAAEMAKLASALARNPNIAPADALSALRRGEQVADLTLSDRAPAPAQALPRRPKAEEDEEVLEEEPAGDDEREHYPARSPATRDGNRVRKVHSLDSFMDEVDRLTRCVQDGDFARLLEADEDASVKVTLLSKQLGYLVRTLATMAGPSNP